MKKTCAVLPSHNEEKTLASVIKPLKEAGIDIFVVDDGSQDMTYEKAGSVKAGHVKVIRLEENQGKGQAIKEAFKYAKGDIIMFLDGDLDIHPAQFHALFDIMKNENADVVIGAKRHERSVVKYPFKRRVLSAGYFYIVKFLFGLPLLDTQTGIKIFKREVLDKIFHRVLIKRYAFDLELLVLAHHNGYTIRPAPIVVDFKGKYGHITPRVIFKILWDTMAIFYRLRIKKYYTGKEQ